jgi:hypothetical protein
VEDNLFSFLGGFIGQAVIDIYFADSIRIRIEENHHARNTTTNRYSPMGGNETE